jgi:hypothetical protein
VGPRAQELYASWRFENQNKVLILVTESFESIGGWPARDWVKFEVKESVPWPQGIGFPEIIEEGQSIDSSEDTVSKPDPNDCEAFPDSLDCMLKKNAFPTLLVGGAVVGGIVLALALRR